MPCTILLLGPAPADVDRQANSSYRQMDMAHLCWNEIGLRVGPAAKNVFCHQGCCEHLLVVKDVRRRHPDDPTHHSSYPYLIQEVTHLVWQQ